MEEKLDSPQIVPLATAGQRGNCQRCGRACIVATTTNPSARPIKLSEAGGYCAGCAFTVWIQTELDLNWILPEGVTMADALRLPHIQAQVGRLFQVGHAEDAEKEIDWEQVIANWGLPLSDKRGKRRSEPRLF